MVAAISGEAAAASSKLDGSGGTGNPRTRSLMNCSEKNGGRESGNGQRRLRSRSVSSRYLSSSPATSSSTSTSTTLTTTTTTTTTTSSSSSSSRRYVSPLVSRSSNSTAAASGAAVAPLQKRSQSVDRRRVAPAARPVTAAGDARLSNAGEGLASKLLFTSSRSLSVSFQGEAFSLPISKAKAAPNVSVSRKGTPERRRGTPLRGKSDGLGGDQVENSNSTNSRPGEQHRWPARTRPQNSLSRSIDYGITESRSNGSSALVKDLEHSMIDDSRGDWFHGRLSMDLGGGRVCDTNSANESSMPSDLTASDTDSVSSGSTSGLQESNVGLSSQLRGGPRGSFASAKFWQETNSRMRRLQDPSSPLSISPSARMLGPPKCVQSKRFSTDSPVISPRTTPSPIRGAPRSASPSKFMMSSISYASRGSSSPSRVDGATGSYSNGSSNGPSILSFSADVRRGKMADNLIVNAHLLRLLYNRNLQWRFVNAQADATFLMQSRTAEKMLWNAWITISELRRSVTIKRSKLNMLRKRLKLTSILRGQLPYLEEWFLQDAEHLSSILGATEALKASILRLPITGKAVADIQNIKDAVRSAVDVMQAMMSSLFSLLPKIEEMNSLVAELKNATAKERSLLTQCKGLMSIVAALQVRDCSMRTHILQLNRDITTSSTLPAHL
ncbi:unnamed protein product [Rhodiola kirilowii]